MNSTINKIALIVAVVLNVMLLACGSALAQAEKPNLLVIFGDDIAYFNDDGRMKVLAARRGGCAQHQSLPTLIL